MSTAIDSISVVVPTYNRRERLELVLAALARQTVEVPVEVIVVSDGSTDGTDTYLAGGETPLPVIPVLQENGGPSVARNAGIDRASGDLVVFVDDDVVAEPGLLDAHLDAHRRHGDLAVVIGPMLDPEDVGLLPWVAWEQRQLAKQYDAMLRGEYQATCRQFYTGNASVRREHLVTLGGFDPAFRRAEDVELAFRMSDIDLEFHFEPAAIGRHYAERSYDAWRGTARAYGHNDVIFGREQNRPWMIESLVASYRRRPLVARAVINTAMRSRLAERVLAGAADGLVRRWAHQLPRRVANAALSTVFAIEYALGAADRLGSRRVYLDLVSGRGADSPGPLGLPARIRRRVVWDVFRTRVRIRRAVLDAVASESALATGITEIAPPSPSSDGERIRRLDGRIAIEPDDGYAVIGRMTVVDDSLPHSDSARRRDEMQYFNGVPTLPHLLERGEPIVVDRAVSLRHPYDHNYFHATIDCVGALALLDAAGELDGRTVVVGPAFADAPVFEAVLDAGLVDRDRVLVQDGRWVESPDIVYGRPTLQPASLRRTVGFLRRAARDASPLADAGERLYLVRDTGQGRRVRGEPALRELLARHGFTALDPGRLSWHEQVAVFARASHVIGVHGAAFTNIMYRAGADLRVVEIQSPGGNEAMFADMSAALCFDHSVVPGTNPSEPGNRPVFDVDHDLVIDAITRS